MSKSQTTGDFLTQIQDAEASAAEIVKKAQQKASSDLVAFEKKEQEKTQKALDEARVEAKGKLKDRQEVAKKRYEKLVTEGKKEADQVRKNTEPKIENVVPQAQSFFVNQLLG